LENKKGVINMSQKAFEKDKARAVEVAGAISEIAHEVDNISTKPSREALEPLRIMFTELEDGFPTATSGDVLHSQVKW
jgi:hypothetical protein